MNLSLSVLGSALAAILILITPLEAAPRQYRYHYMETLGGRVSGPWDINNNGQVVGSARNGQGQWRAFLWEDGVMYNLNDLSVNLAPDKKLREATAINEKGWIVGKTIVETTNRSGFLLIPVKRGYVPLGLLLD